MILQSLLSLTLFFVKASFVYMYVYRNLSQFLCFYVVQKDESFYTVAWACSDDGSPFIVAGGSKGIVRVIDAGREKIHRVFWLQ